MTALRATQDGGGHEGLRASAPRLAASSADLRESFDAPRMGGAIAWIRGRIVRGEPLLLAEHHGVIFDRLDDATLLAVEQEDVSTDAATSEADLRAQLVGMQVREAVVVQPDALYDPHSDRMQAAGHTAAAGLAIAYNSRGVGDPKVSPLAIRGGLTLPPSLIVIGHAYANANGLFW